MRFLNRTGLIVVGAVGLVGLATLAGCSTRTQEAASGPPATPLESPSLTAAADYSALTSVVDKTRAAIEAGDFAKAKAEFETFESVWAPVEDGIKAKSSSAYDSIEESMDKVSGALKASQPNKDEVLAALKTMDEAIASVSK
ncbi:hypothetical protein [Leptolyngbya sp. O-77]|uniref:hypothetical protein n=1 Tax=Leptolyngbya sp. O-77 TaxID=1080068 RepID=UPI00074D4550|nr:hypothetical protein [Leptolyngbya sp. O-77]BAU44288.1 hypothetical protein O77CONTIG1_04127 [Leptolyngbya sp. O-77]